MQNKLFQNQLGVASLLVLLASTLHSVTERRACMIKENGDVLRCMVSIHNKTFGKDNLLISKLESDDWQNLLEDIGNYKPIKAVSAKGKRGKYLKALIDSNKILTTAINQAFKLLSPSFMIQRAKDAGFSDLKKFTRETVNFEKINLSKIEKSLANLKKVKPELEALQKEIEKDPNFKPAKLAKKQDTADKKFTQETLLQLADFILTTIDKVIKSDWPALQKVVTQKQR